MSLEMRTVRVMADDETISRIEDLVKVMKKLFRDTFDKEIGDFAIKIGYHNALNAKVKGKVAKFITFEGSYQEACWFSFLMRERANMIKSEYKEYSHNWSCHKCKLSLCKCGGRVESAKNMEIVVDHTFYNYDDKYNTVQEMRSWVETNGEKTEKFTSEMTNSKVFFTGTTKNMEMLAGEIEKHFENISGVAVMFNLWDCNNCGRREEFCTCTQV